MDMIVTCLPSPTEAQAYRIKKIYNKFDPEEIDEDDEESKTIDPADFEALETALETCDTEGPTCVLVSKTIPFKQGTRAFGRVFSGTVRQGDTIIVKTSISD